VVPLLRLGIPLAFSPDITREPRWPGGASSPGGCGVDIPGLRPASEATGHFWPD